MYTMTTNIDVSIILVNYNSTDMLINAISSIHEHTRGVTYEIIVIDNASPDNGYIKLKNVIQDNTTLIQCKQNLGFGGANNIGLKIAKGKYILFLNPDTILLNNAIYIYKSYIEQHIHNRIGALGCILLDEKKSPGNSYNSFLTPIGIIRDCLRLNNMPRFKNIHAPINVDFITGAALFVPAKILHEIGTFDEQFFMYCEEVDLEKRMADNGYQRIIIPGPLIIHYDGGSFDKKNKRSAHRRYTYDTSRMLYIKKYFTPWKYSLFRIAFFCCRIPAVFNYHYSIADNIKYFRLLIKRS